MGTPWYETYFDEVYLDDAREALTPERSEREVDFLIDQLALEPGMRLLDLCCGHGRHAVALAARGFDVVGQDLSAGLLEKAAGAAREAGVEVRFVERDMREACWREEFDAVVNLFTAFGYCEDDAENFRALTALAGALKPGGRFCVDVVSYAWLLRHWVERAWSRSEAGNLHVVERRMDWASGVLETEHTFRAATNGRGGVAREKDGRVVRSRLRVFPVHELIGWLRRAGLSEAAAFGDFDGAPYTLESERLILVGEKRPQGEGTALK